MTGKEENLSVKINAKEFRKMCRLVKSSCCNLSDGNCLLLDDGETHTCVQLISKFHIFCNYFKLCVLPLDKELYSKLMNKSDTKSVPVVVSIFTRQLRTKSIAIAVQKKSSVKNQL